MALPNSKVWMSGRPSFSSTVAPLETPIEEIWDNYNFVFHYRIRALLTRILKEGKDTRNKNSIKEQEHAKAGK
jgi:hypothetical protein